MHYLSRRFKKLDILDFFSDHAPYNDHNWCILCVTDGEWFTKVTACWHMTGRQYSHSCQWSDLLVIKSSVLLSCSQAQKKCFQTFKHSFYPYLYCLQAWVVNVTQTIFIDEKDLQTQRLAICKNKNDHVKKRWLWHLWVNRNKELFLCYYLHNYTENLYCRERSDETYSMK